MDTISKIRQEIERRKALLKPQKGQGVILCQEIIKQFDSLISFIEAVAQPVMKDNTVNAIRTEIERRFSEYNQDSNHHIQAAECASILDFLDTLEEPVKGLDVTDFCKPIDPGIAQCIADHWFEMANEEPVCDELDEACRKECREYINKMMPDTMEAVSLHFTKFGANWQKAKDDRLVDIIYQQGIEKGKDDMRETLKRKEKK